MTRGRGFATRTRGGTTPGRCGVRQASEGHGEADGTALFASLDNVLNVCGALPDFADTLAAVVERPDLLLAADILIAPYVAVAPQQLACERHLTHRSGDALWSER